MSTFGYQVSGFGAGIDKDRGSDVLIDFNGTNSYLSILDDFTDSFESHPNDITAVWWMTSDVSSVMPIFGIVQGSNDSDGFVVEQQTDRAIWIRVGPDSSGQDLVFKSDNLNEITSGLSCYMMSTNRSAGTISMYRNDTAIAMTRNPTHSNDLDLGPGYFILGRYAQNLAGGFNGCMNRVWIDQRTVDFSVESNRRKFIDAGGNRVGVGDDGSLPFGTQPKIFINGDSSTITQLGSISFSGSNLTRSNLTNCGTTLP
jgi:hypothetical protein